MRMALICLALQGTVFADDLVAVYVRDGRILTGRVDSRTNERELWLHAAEPSILVLSSIPWLDIKEAKVGERFLSADQFRKIATQLRAPLPLPLLKQPAVAIEPQFRPARVILDEVQSIEIVPELANWSGNAVPDGLLLRVYPLTLNRDRAIASGLVNVRLLGRRWGTQERLESPRGFGFWREGGSIREYAARLDNARYIEIGRWTERLETVDRIQPALLHLRFRRINPELDLDVGFDGIVEARLSVDGQGIYVATAPVQLRTFSPLREELQLYRGTRYFPDE